jgi:hypothetical protein
MTKNLCDAPFWPFCKLMNEKKHTTTHEIKRIITLILNEKTSRVEYFLLQVFISDFILQVHLVINRHKKIVKFKYRTRVEKNLFKDYNSLFNRSPFLSCTSIH